MPAFKPSENDRHRVMMLVVCGIAPDRIAGYLGISKQTLYRHFAGELENGNDMANAAVADSLYRNALEGMVSAQIFWMKAIAKWNNKEVSDVGAFGAVEAEAEEVTLSDREMARRIAYVLDRAARNQGPETI